MRLILKEYLQLLKEDKELDSVITNLAIDMDLIPLSNITKGRQHGVDLAAIGNNENGEKVIFLFTIKRGNINRNNWSISPADVKPSIEDIKDVYLHNYIPNEYKNYKKKIILCFNGILEQTLLQDMAKLKDKINCETILLEEWNIDKIISQIEQYQTLETLFDKDVMLNFRRTLALIDLREYKNKHYFLFLDSLLEIQKELTEKEIEKRIRLINLCLAITVRWCENSSNLKSAFFITERTLLQVYHWLNIQTKDYPKASTIITLAFSGLIQIWIEITGLYLKKLKSNYTVKYGLFNRSLTFEEYYISTNEQIGILSSIGNCYIELSKVFHEKDKKASTLFYQTAIAIAESLLDLVDNNPSSNYLLFDDDYIDIISAHRLLIETKFLEQGNNWLSNMVRYVIRWYYSENCKPIFYYNLDKLLERNDEFNSSCSLLILAELCVIYKNSSLYKELQEFVSNEVKEIDLQMIFPEQNIDDLVFIGNTKGENNSVLTNVKLPESIKELETSILVENHQLRFEKETNAMKDGLAFLYFISFRHHRNYPFPQFWRDLLIENYSSKFSF